MPKKPYKIIMILAAVVGALWLLSRRVLSGPAVAVVAPGYPTTTHLSPHFTWSELWGPAEGLTESSRWASPGIPSFDGRVMAQLAAWLELVRGREGGRPIIARTIYYAKPLIGEKLNIFVILYPPSGSDLKLADIASACRDTFPPAMLGDVLLPEEQIKVGNWTGGGIDAKPCVMLWLSKNELMRQVNP
jgi:hypothetical protein